MIPPHSIVALSIAMAFSTARRILFTGGAGFIGCGPRIQSCAHRHTHTHSHIHRKKETPGDLVTTPWETEPQWRRQKGPPVKAPPTKLPAHQHCPRLHTDAAPGQWWLREDFPQGLPPPPPAPEPTESTGGVAGVQLSHQSSRLDELNSTNFWVYGRCRFCFLRQKIMDPNSQSSKILVFFHLFINQLIAGGAPPYMNRIRLKTMAITVCYNRLDPSTGKETP